MKPTIGFIGLGLMGKPMAQNLIRAGFSVVVWNRTKARAQELVSEGAKLEEIRANGESRGCSDYDCERSAGAGRRVVGHEWRNGRLAARQRLH